MNKQTSRTLFSFVILAPLVLGLAACGVKGKPLPPLEPAEIGRGAPTYKRAAEHAKPAVIPESSMPKASPTPGRAQGREQ